MGALPICQSTGFGHIPIASASLAGLPINRSTLFSHIQFEFLNSLLCRYADQQVLDIYPLTVPSLPVCRSTDRRLFHTYSLNFRIPCSADLPINRFWAYTHYQCQLCRSANQRINAFFTRTYSKISIPCSADFPFNRFWTYTYCQCQLCRSADQRINAFFT